jgi:hypothetical protein
MSDQCTLLQASPCHESSLSWNSTEGISYQLPDCPHSYGMQGLMLLLTGPYVDSLVSDRSVLDYQWTNPALLQLLLSCSIAVCVNISQFMCLGRFSAVTFQVIVLSGMGT